MKRALGKLLTPPDLRARLASSAQDAKAWAAKVKSETSAEPIVLQPGQDIVL